MSLSIDGFWKAGFWSETFWAAGFWYEGAPVTPPAPTAQTGSPGRPKPSRRRQVIIDGRRYRVSPEEEAELVEQWIERLEAEKVEKQQAVEVKTAEVQAEQPKPSKSAKPARKKAITKIPSIKKLLDDIKEIDKQRAKARARYLRLRAEMDDEEEAISLILSMFH